MSTRLQKDVSKALLALVPAIPLADALAVKDIANRAKLRSLPPPIAVWLAVTTHVRHEHTEYDTLLDEGYDSDTARHFVLDEMNVVLTRWRATRLVDGTDDGQSAG